ncbi:hypothetical protein RUND412_004506 [Rhizina undulata]
MSSPPTDPSDLAFPHSLSIRLPLPSNRIAEALRRALAVDKEISPFVQREFEVDGEAGDVLVVRYKATTARMLRVATNGVFESLGVVVRVCEELDVDVLEPGGL